MPAHGLRGWVNSQPRGSHGELCVRDLSKNPGNDVTSWQQNPTEPGTWVSRPPQRQGAPSRSLAAKMFCCLPLPRGRGLGRAHRQSVWERARHWLRHPPRGLCPFARRKRKVTREPQARPGPLSHPIQVTLSPLPVSWMRVSRGVSASSKPRQMWVRSLWASCVHTPGESRLGRMGRVQAGPAAQADLTPSGGSPSSWVGT